MVRCNSNLNISKTTVILQRIIYTEPHVIVSLMHRKCKNVNKLPGSRPCLFYWPIFCPPVFVTHQWTCVPTQKTSCRSTGTTLRKPIWTPQRGSTEPRRCPTYNKTASRTTWNMYGTTVWINMSAVPVPCTFSLSLSLLFYALMHFIFVFVQAETKLREEEKRALRYLETRRECNSVQAVSVFHGLISDCIIGFI